MWYIMYCYKTSNLVLINKENYVSGSMSLYFVMEDYDEAIALVTDIFKGNNCDCKEFLPIGVDYNKLIIYKNF